MFDSFFNLGNIVGLYSGSPLVAAVTSATYSFGGGSAPSNEVLSFLIPLFAILAPIIFFIWLIGIAASVLMIVAWWKVFAKAGRPGWAAIVPIYNTVVMFQIVGMSPWLILLALIPFAGAIALFVFMIIMNIKMAKAFGEDGGFAVGLILLPIVFVPILAFGKAQFVGLPSISPSVASSGPIPPPTPPTTPDPIVPPTNPTGTV